VLLAAMGRKKDEDGEGEKEVKRRPPPPPPTVVAGEAAPAGLVVALSRGQRKLRCRKRKGRIKL
jgi:hypothetical protein